MRIERYVLMTLLFSAAPSPAEDLPVRASLLRYESSDRHMVTAFLTLPGDEAGPVFVEVQLGTPCLEVSDPGGIETLSLDEIPDCRSTGMLHRAPMGYSSVAVGHFELLEPWQPFNARVGILTKSGWSWRPIEVQRGEHGTDASDLVIVPTSVAAWDRIEIAIPSEVDLDNGTGDSMTLSGQIYQGGIFARPIDRTTTGVGFLLLRFPPPTTGGTATLRYRASRGNLVEATFDLHVENVMSDSGECSWSPVVERGGRLVICDCLLSRVGPLRLSGAPRNLDVLVQSSVSRTLAIPEETPLGLQIVEPRVPLEAPSDSDGMAIEVVEIREVDGYSFVSARGREGQLGLRIGLGSRLSKLLPAKGESVRRIVARLRTSSWIGEPDLNSLAYRLDPVPEACRHQSDGDEGQGGNDLLISPSAQSPFEPPSMSETRIAAVAGSGMKSLSEALERLILLEPVGNRSGQPMYDESQVQRTLLSGLAALRKREVPELNPLVDLLEQEAAALVPELLRPAREQGSVSAARVELASIRRAARREGDFRARWFTFAREDLIPKAQLQAFLETYQVLVDRLLTLVEERRISQALCVRSLPAGGFFRMWPKYSPETAYETSTNARIAKVFLGRYRYRLQGATGRVVEGTIDFLNDPHLAFECLFPESNQALQCRRRDLGDEPCL